MSTPSRKTRWLKSGEASFRTMTSTRRRSALLELSLNAKSRPVEGALGRFPEEDRDVDVAVLARGSPAETPEEVDSDDWRGSLREVARDARPYILGVHIPFHRTTDCAAQRSCRAGAKAVCGVGHEAGTIAGKDGRPPMIDSSSRGIDHDYRNEPPTICGLFFFSRARDHLDAGSFLRPVRRTMLRP